MSLSKNSTSPRLSRVMHRAFTLIELLVVLAIVIIMLSVAVPAVKALLRNNGRSQAVNLVRAQLSAARTVALASHRQAGVVFFEETIANAPSPTIGQTAMQIIVEDFDQNRSQYLNGGLPPSNTVFVYYSKDRQYLPAGIQVAALNEDPSKIMVAENTSANTRVILFDANGQMILRTGVARPDVVGTSDGGYPKAYADWKFAAKNGPPDDGVSSPGVFIFSLNDFKQQNFGAAAYSAKSDWIKQNADCLVINAYTGNILR